MTNVCLHWQHDWVIINHINTLHNYSSKIIVCEEADIIFIVHMYLFHRTVKFDNHIHWLNMNHLLVLKHVFLHQSIHNEFLVFSYLYKYEIIFAESEDTVITWFIVRMLQLMYVCLFLKSAALGEFFCHNFADAHFLP